MSDQLWFHIAAKMRPVEWSDVKPGECVYYYLKKRVRDREAHGPCKMIDSAMFKMKNAQGVPLNYDKHHDSIQLMVPVDPETYIP